MWTLCSLIKLPPMEAPDTCAGVTQRKEPAATHEDLGSVRRDDDHLIGTVARPDPKPIARRQAVDADTVRPVARRPGVSPICARTVPSSTRYRVRGFVGNGLFTESPRRTVVSSLEAGTVCLK